MRPSLSLFSKASRLPLTSKRANKDYYKGTRTGNIMRRKRIASFERTTGKQIYNDDGTPKNWTLMGQNIDEARMTSYIVPPGLAESDLKPLVFLGDKKEGGIQGSAERGYPGSVKMKPGFGFDGRYYEKVRQDILERKGKL